MSLQAMVDSLEGISDDLRAHYVKQENGKFLLGVTPINGFALEDVTGLKKALTDERANVKEANQKLNVFEGIDPANAKDALSKIKDMANWTPEDKVKEQIEARIKQVTDKHATDVAASDEKIKNLNGQLSTHVIDNAAIAALNKFKGNTKLLLPHIRNQVKTEVENGTQVARVIDPATGNPMMTNKTGSTALMGIEELVENMRGNKDFAGAFEGNGNRGSGAGSQDNGNPGTGDLGNNEINFSDNPIDQLSRAHKNNSGAGT